MTTNTIFFNQVFDKKRLKVLITWVLKEFGEKQALRVVEELKTIGFQNATQAGLSIGLNDLTTPSQKPSLLSKAELDMSICDQDFNGGRITATERNQRIVDTWHRVSETLRKQVVEHFSTYDQLNPVYIMALSGARGNFSQVRQLVGMRGLMADPQGQIISFPIRSNLREGLTLTEYFISCSGARKGLVDTALRTADTGYLTRRLVDVSHHIVIKKICCNTEKGITVRALKSENKVLLSLSDRLVGRVLAQNIEYHNLSDHSSSDTFCEAKDLPKAKLVQKQNFYKPNQNKEDQKFDKTMQNEELSAFQKNIHNTFLAQKNQEIDPTLAFKIQTVKKEVIIRSPLTCALAHSVCQLCYGWSLSQGRLVSLGEAVGVIAAQSIGEPGTQLTMRTFHTGGVFSGDLLQEIRAPHSGRIEFSKAFQGLMIRTTDGRIAFLTKTSGEILLKSEPVEKNPIKTFLPLNFPTHSKLLKPDHLARKKLTHFTFEESIEKSVQKSEDTSLPFSNPFVNSIKSISSTLRCLLPSSFVFTTNSIDNRVRNFTLIKSRYKQTPEISLVLMEFYKAFPYNSFYPVLKESESKDCATKDIFTQAKIRKVYLKSKYTLPIIIGRYSSESYNSWQDKLVKNPLVASAEQLDLNKKGTFIAQDKDQVKNKNYIVLLLNSKQNKVVLFNKITKYYLLYNYNKIKKNANKINFSSNKVEEGDKQTCLQFQALTLLFVRQAEYVNKNQLLAQISILGEEGNQPIKSRQTIFAELSGKVFETQGGVSGKKFIKNINKLSKNAETIVFKHELVNTLKGRASISIQPEKSAKLGFFHILATQIAASFGVNGIEINGKRSSYKNQVFADILQSKMYPSQVKSQNTSKMYPMLLSSRKQLDCFDTSSKNWTNASNFYLPVLRSEKPTNFTSFSLYQRSRIGSIHVLPPTRISLGYIFRSKMSCQNKNAFGKNKTEVLLTFCAAKGIQAQQNARALKNSHKIHSYYNPYTAQFFSSTHNKSVIVSLLKRQNFKIKKVTLLHSTDFKESEFFKQKQQHSDSLFLRTIAQEGDLVDSDYKKCLY